MSFKAYLVMRGEAAISEPTLVVGGKFLIANWTVDLEIRHEVDRGDWLVGWLVMLIGNQGSE
jgi:purine nucleoside permease